MFQTLVYLRDRNFLLALGLKSLVADSVATPSLLKREYPTGDQSQELEIRRPRTATGGVIGSAS